MSEPKHQPAEAWTPRYRLGQVVKTPEGDRTITATWGRSIQLDKPVKPEGSVLAYAWFDEDKLKGWETL